MPTIANVELTEKEVELIGAILLDEYNNGDLSVDCTPWSWSVVDGSKSRAGVLSSLQSKGLVQTQDSGRDAICYFTDEGKKVAAVVIAEIEAERAKEQADYEASAAEELGLPAPNPLLSGMSAFAIAACGLPVPEPCLTRECVEAGTDWPSQADREGIERGVAEAEAAMRAEEAAGEGVGPKTAALCVIALTPHIRAYLQANDPKALAQVEAAILGAQLRADLRIAQDYLREAVTLGDAFLIAFHVDLVNKKAEKLAHHTGNPAEVKATKAGTVLFRAEGGQWVSVPED